MQQLTRPDGHTIAYHRTPGDAPGIVFLGGFRSDMTGSKALALEAHAKARGQAFLRFDYLGHGASSGRFAEGTIGRWREDALAALDELTEGPQVLVGSSMGGWVMLLTALARPERIAGLLGIAAAPDFTEDLIRPVLTEEQHAALARDGRLETPSAYSEEPDVITGLLLDEAREHLLLRTPLALPAPLRLIHGLADPDVPWQTALRLAEAVEGADVEITLVKGAGHRLSEPADLERLRGTLDRLLEDIAG